MEYFNFYPKKIIILIAILLFTSCFRSEEEKLQRQLLEKVEVLGNSEVDSSEVANDLVFLIEKSGPKSLSYIEKALYDGNHDRTWSACRIIAEVPFDESIEILKRFMDSQKEIEQKQHILSFVTAYHKKPSVLRFLLYAMKMPELEISKSAYDSFIVLVFNKTIENVFIDSEPEIWTKAEGNGRLSGPRRPYRLKVALKWEKWVKDNFANMIYNFNKGIVQKTDGKSYYPREILLKPIEQSD